MDIKNLMVTGGCGFIGSNFIDHLLAKPDFQGRIVNVDKLTYAGNPENLRGIDIKYPGRYIFIKADICDAGLMQEIFDRYDIDAICHFAAESHVDRSIKRPESFIHTNIIGTFNLLEIANVNQEKFQIFHHISTDDVYVYALAAPRVYLQRKPPTVPTVLIQRPRPLLTTCSALTTRHSACPRPCPTVPIITDPISFRRN